MTLDERIQQTLGQLVFSNLVLQQKLEECQAKVSEKPKTGESK